MSDWTFDWGAHEALIRENGLTIDRPRYTRHPDHPEIVYPIDYGYINGTVGEDGVEIDLFVGTADTGLVGVLRTVDHRKGDTEFKLIYNCSASEVYLVNGFINFAPALMSGELRMRAPMAELWGASPARGCFNHLDLNVRDLVGSKAFYDAFLGWLGYRTYQAWEGGYSWRKGESYLTLVQAGPEYLGPGYHRKRVGVNHLAFSVASPDEVELFHREFLLPRNIPVLYGGPLEDPSGTYAVFFEDPDRLKLELVYQPALS
jgi:catechol 2,3-dioxygenase-like lactoylglutathione lyase family enzyme